MMAARKLWKVTRGWRGGLTVDPATVERPESKAKVFDIYVPNAIRSGSSHDFIDVWVDERDGTGWRLYKRIERTDYYPKWES
jgi:hypothetical protein